MEAYWMTTQRFLQHGIDPIVKRPKLTEALLKRPPFRFLHDIVSEVTRRTGFAEGLFAADELAPLELKDKDAKLRYLTKIINCVGLTLNANVPVRPAKVYLRFFFRFFHLGLEISTWLSYRFWLGWNPSKPTSSCRPMLAQAATTDSQKAAKAVYRCLAGDFMPSSDHSGLISRESASSSQSVSSEKLRRSIYSPSPDAAELSNKTRTQEVATPPQPVDATKVQVIYSPGAVNEQEEDAVVESMASTELDLSHQAPIQTEVHGLGQIPGRTSGAQTWMIKMII
ncbi:TRAF3-interacting protein 1 isoform X1 [Selaginella moellendorffii]|uniref:TRAF3-interacting protein 1 isoform X1 n=1 Tax=Selaginella moellendorffii TaxID=88036 RepID=UPI000D1C5739|nr:TRAF3-interacting protein 1 isoform X1 [Selaginella moellendorffii]XP_024521082.1 TRAF3-interacting protein 1 isoform X1 [Selaginella moellendorffii]XP_024521083.1 TRAF3-interacting protein 1 isoform X1 [Selaginella moellendorffii]|eukprot:XP_024521081.1 TRAF3-interacting protein 1 isoform X1 [Selaginella moellendorffii]